MSAGKVAQSYLFYGPEGVGKLTTAFELAKVVNCPNQKNYDSCDNCPSCRKIDHFSHPDVDFVFSTPKFKITDNGQYKKGNDQIQVQKFIEQLKATPYCRYQFSKATSIHIDTIRNIERKILFRPNEGNYRVIIMADADKMVHQAANAFLKTLEEPPSYVIIILTTTRLSALLPTIISRCQKIRFNAVPSEIIKQHLIEKYNVDDRQAEISARISNGSMAKAILMSQTEQVEARTMALEFVQFILNKHLEGVHNFSANFAQNKNEELLKEIFDFLILWFGDLVYLHHSPERIVNIDQKEELEKFYQIGILSDQSIGEIINLIEQGKKLLEGHINFELIVIDTFFQIYKRVYQKR